MRGHGSGVDAEATDHKVKQSTLTANASLRWAQGANELCRARRGPVLSCRDFKAKPIDHELSLALTNPTFHGGACDRLTLAWVSFHPHASPLTHKLWIEL